ncbi:hypothetical protein L6164_013396 [Bauhinia variegata]|uniref:Uncharacterized protein n=1 Tax=Bauhinia variegata TaxID=167791 RepID=A0ACB9NEY8_BAUVA|nr:hypothetical protein L6164_013396 [Bauhinia variegata]
MISNIMTDGNGDVSGSNAATPASHAAKRVRHEDEDGLQKFKGVVPQQNGHWGAQIYANHQRIWLGTFKSEIEAAMAYDSASIKLRMADQSHRNFPWNHQTAQESHFQSHYSTEAILSMIKNGTYQSKFASFLSNFDQTQQWEGIERGANLIRENNGDEKHLCIQLFQKELTPSDVGKLNRLVIPKRHAIRYFPNVGGGEEENNDNNRKENGGVGDSAELVFYDKFSRSWKFRYCYWRSSQSYVFTRGWNRFVKDKNLRAKDIIVFYTCEQGNRGKGGHVFFLIDVICNGDERRNGFGGMSGYLKQNLGNAKSSYEVEDEDPDGENDEKELSTLQSSQNVQKGLRLFGVHIN